MKSPWLWIAVLMALLLGTFAFLFYTQYTASLGAGAENSGISSSDRFQG